MDKEHQIKQLESALEESKKEAQENLDGWKRAKADFINYKKRQEELMDEFRKFACENVVEDFIPILDNMELSLEHIPENQKEAEWTKGVLHIKRMLEDALKANGAEAIEVKDGDEFNPEIHEAVDSSRGAALPCPSEPCEAGRPPSSDKVANVLKKGYKLNGRVIRAAKVIV